MKNLDNGKINDYENKKEKENKEMSTGTFTQYHSHTSTKKSCTYQFVRHQYKKTTLHELLIFNI